MTGIPFLMPNPKCIIKNHILAFTLIIFLIVIERQINSKPRVLICKFIIKNLHLSDGDYLTYDYEME